MSRREGKRRRLAGVLMAAVGTAGVIAAWSSGEGAAGTLSAVIAAAGLWLAWAGQRNAVAARVEVATVADRLADQIAAQWSTEAKRRDLNRPPLPVSWQPADPSLAQPWTRLQALIHADTRRVLAVGRLLPGDRNDCTAYAASGVNQATGPRP